MADGARSFLLLLGITAFARLPGFFVSLYSGDEATYSALALRILAGAMPYQGAVDHKPVGIELTYALVYGVFGACDVRLVRALLVCVIATTGWVLGSIAAKLDGRPQARWVGVLYVLLTVAGLPGDVQAANAELFLNLPLALAGRCIVSRRWLAAGALTAIAGLFKYQAVLAGAGWLAIALLEHIGWRERVRRLGRLAIGFVLPWAALLGGFVLKGVWQDFVFWGWRFNFRYMSLLSASESARNALQGTLLMLICWSPLLVCVWAGRKESVRRLPLFWFLAMLAAVMPGGRYFPHYYLVALPPLCLLAARGAALRGWLRSTALGLGFVLICGSEISAWFWYRIKPVLAAEKTTCTAVGQYVRARSTAQDKVFVWGSSSHTYYYYLRRVMATRFAFNNYHTGRIWGTRMNDEVNAVTDPYVVREAWPLLMRDLEATHPLFIIDAATGATHLGMFDWHPISRFPELSRFVGRYYEPSTLVSGVPVYRLVTR